MSPSSNKRKRSNDVTGENRDTQSEEACMQRVLDKTLNELPRRDLQRTLDENHASVVFILARELQFRKEEILEIRLKCAGGGKPHEIFVEYIMHSDTGITINRLMEACEKLKKTQVVDLLIEIKGKRVNCSELNPAEYAKLYPGLVEHADDGNIMCWKDLAEELGLGNIVANMEGTIAQGFQYSAAKALLDNLIQRNMKIHEFETKLEEIQKDPKLPTVERVIAEFEAAIKKLVQLENMKKLRGEKKRNARSDAR